MRLDANPGHRLESSRISGVPMMSMSSAGRSAQYPDSARLLFVIRESSTGAERELANLATDAFLRHSYRKDVSELLSAGLEPMTAPTQWNGAALPFSRGRGALVRVGQAWALFALSSAAKDTDGIQNEFTEEFAKAMSRVRPHVVVTTSISRITRHGHHVSLALRSFTEHRPILECDEGVLDFQSPHADGEFQQWASYAAKDRNTIVARMEAGHRRAHRNGRFSFRGTFLPDGYLRTDDGRIVLSSATQVSILQDALRLLAMPDNSRHLVAQHIQASGAFFPRRKLPGNDPSQSINLPTAQDLVDRLLVHLDAYESGVLRIDRTPVLPVLFSSSNDGEFGSEGRGLAVSELFEYPLPLPSGGWASTEIFRAIRSSRGDFIERSRIATTDPHKTDHHLPLVGYRWRVGTQEWGLHSGSSGQNFRYYLACREADPKALRALPGEQEWRRSLRRGWGDLSQKDPRFVCSINAAELHRSLADSFGQMTDFVLTTATLGVQEKGGDAPATSQDAADALQLELRRATQDRDRAKSAFYLVPPEDSLRELFLGDLRTAEEKVSALSAALEDAEAASSWPDGGVDIKSDASPILMVLARLRSTPGPISSNVAAALQAVLYGFSMAFDAEAAETRWSASLALPSPEGSPVTYVRQEGSVRASPSRAARTTPAIRGQRALEKSARDRSLTPEEERDAAKELMRLGLLGTAAKCVLGAPIEVRQVVIHHLLGIARGTDVDPGFADLVLAGYQNARGKGQYSWNAAAGLRQSVLDIQAQEGSLDRHALMESMGAFKGWTAFYAQIRTAESTWLAPVLAERYYVAASKSGGQMVRIHARTCPHCGATVDIVARVRECPVGLLCSACLRMPVIDSPVFPRSYRRLAKRPQRSRATIRPQPTWWDALRLAVRQRPDVSLTVLGSMLNRPRWEIEEAVDILGLSVASRQDAADGWTDDVLRRAYIEEDRRLVDLADEMGISTGTLSKRLARAGIQKNPHGVKA